MFWYLIISKFKKVSESITAQCLPFLKGKTDSNLIPLHKLFHYFMIICSEHGCKDPTWNLIEVDCLRNLEKCQDHIDSINFLRVWIAILLIDPHETTLKTLEEKFAAALLKLALCKLGKSHSQAEDDYVNRWMNRHTKLMKGLINNQSHGPTVVSESVVIVIVILCKSRISLAHCMRSIVMHLLFQFIPMEGLFLSISHA